MRVIISTYNLSKTVRVNIVFGTTFSKEYLISFVATFRLIDFGLWVLYILTFKGRTFFFLFFTENVSLSVPVTCYADHNADLTSNNNISKTVVLTLASQKRFL